MLEMNIFGFASGYLPGQIVEKRSGGYHGRSSAAAT
jgi:hypothetical protein